MSALKLVPSEADLQNVARMLISVLIQGRAKGAGQATAALAWEQIIREKLTELVPCGTTAAGDATERRPAA